MQLYYKPGACSLATHIALREIGADFVLERVDTDLKKTESGEDFQAVNPKGYVPALRLDDGTVVTENPALLQFLADQRLEAELAPPAASPERVRFQEWLGFLNSELHKAYSPFFLGKTLSDGEREEAAAKVAARLSFVERHLSDGRAFLLGQTFSIADAYAFAIMNWSGFIKFDLSPFPFIRRFLETVGARPTVVAAMRAEGLIP